MIGEITVNQDRRLWLSCEAAIYPATVDEVDLLLEFLEAPESEWLQTALQLKRWLEQQRASSPMSRQPIPCRRPLGLHVLLPNPVAAWLAHALELSDDEVNILRKRFLDWLEDSQTSCCATKSAGIKTQ
jgi:hypothetical protein